MFIPRILINYLNHRYFKARDQRLNAPETDPVKPYAMILSSLPSDNLGCPVPDKLFDSTRLIFLFCFVCLFVCLFVFLHPRSLSTVTSTKRVYFVIQICLKEPKM